MTFEVVTNVNIENRVFTNEMLYGLDIYQEDRTYCHLQERLFCLLRRGHVPSRTMLNYARHGISVIIVIRITGVVDFVHRPEF
jgi:hypothetical protein